MFRVLQKNGAKNYLVEKIKTNGRASFFRFKKYFFCFIFVLFSAPQDFFALGRRDAVIDQADKLISEKRYMDALKLISQSSWIWEDSFDFAQERLRVIMRITDLYNQLAGSLLDAVRDSPQDVDKLLAMGGRLRELENAAHSETTRNVISQIYIAARFSRYSMELNKIMTEARVMIDAGEYAGALEKYQSGFMLYRDEFINAGFGASEEAEVFSRLSSIADYTESISKMLQPLRELSSQASLLPKTRAAAPQAASLCESAAEYFNALINIKKSTRDFRDYFQERSDSIDSEQKDAQAKNYLFLLVYLIDGRENQNTREGFLGVYDAVWNSAQPQMEELLTGILRETNSYTASLLEIGAYQSVLDIEKNSIAANEKLSDLLKKYISFTSTDDVERFLIAEDEIPRAKLELYVNIDYILKSQNFFFDAARAGREYENLYAAGYKGDTLADWENGLILIDKALEIEETKRLKISEIGNIIENGVILSENDFNQLNSYSQILNVSEALDALEKAKGFLQKLSGIVLTDELRIVSTSYTLKNHFSEKNISAMEGTVDEAAALSMGEIEEDENGEEAVIKRPQEAIEKLGGLTEAILNSEETLQNTLSSYDNEPDRIPKDGGLGVLRLETLALLERLNQIKRIQNEQIGLLTVQMAEAEQLYEEGLVLIRRARLELENKSFSTARSMTEEAAQKYATSLSLRQSPKVRRSWDETLTPLNAEIARLEYETVVDEIRRLVTRARAVYFDGEYENAELFLTQAANRWAVVSPTPDSEIVYWLSLVRGALSLQSGRTIPETAPLYMAMSQLLNEARKNYDAAVSLIKKGEQKEAEARLNRARGQTSEIRFIFPMNREAGVLDLRIDQMLNPENFDRQFTSRLAAAAAETKRGSREAYAEMQNLASIRPDYPGIQNMLYQAEIDIGLRQKPVDASTANRSAELARRAQALLNNPGGYDEALRLVNEALRINPNSSLAMNVKDRLQISMSRQNVAVVDRNTEQEYIRAISELQRGNTIIALSIVQRLLQNSSNRNSVKINELLRRIEAML
ncbi:MAG: hypothetical protein LBC53_00875 [Spirochaetaceae bacterium]|nr:hypothetical protein [Spirochaetaceae bacterium]